MIPILRELGRLEGHRADADAEVGAVDLLADPGHAREQEEQQRAPAAIVQR